MDPTHFRLEVKSRSLILLCVTVALRLWPRRFEPLRYLCLIRSAGDRRSQIVGLLLGSFCRGTHSVIAALQKSGSPTIADDDHKFASIYAPIPLGFSQKRSTTIILMVNRVF
jgi:hypothetical protein